MQLQVGVKILLKNREGKYLMVRRNPKKYPDMRPSWDIVGGRIEPGTSLVENLKREITEEVGLSYKGQPKLVAAQDIFVRRYADSADSADGDREIVRHVVRLTYTGEMDGEPVLSDEHLEGGWYSAEEILDFGKENLDSYLWELLENGTILR